MEWQRLYPVKKILFLGAWLFCVFIFIAAIILLVRDGDIEALLGGGICGIIAFVTVRPIIKYVRTSYHCMPYFNKIFSKCEQETFVASEEFQFFESVEVNNYLFPLGISKHWIYANMPNLCCGYQSTLICWWKMYSMWKIESEQQSGSPSILDIFSYPYQQQR